jgi:polysaccharide export outer membrane protein
MNDYWAHAASSRASGVVNWVDGSARLTQAQMKRVVDPFARNPDFTLDPQPSSFAWADNRNKDSARGVWPVYQHGDPTGAAGFYVVDFKRSMLHWGIARFELVRAMPEVPVAAPSCAHADNLAAAAAATNVLESNSGPSAPHTETDPSGWVTRVYGRWTTVQDPPRVEDGRTIQEESGGQAVSAAVVNSPAPVSPPPRASLELAPSPAASSPAALPPPPAAPVAPANSAAMQGASGMQAISSTQAYTIATGDKIKINTFGEDRFSGEFLVHRDGKITFPLFGDIPAAGLTPAQLASAISGKLAPDYLRDPRVTAEVIGFRPVYILGEVARPGEYPYAEGMTMYALVAQAGGFSYRANHKRAFVRHDSETAEQRLDLQSSTPVRPGDTIRIPQRIF